MKRRDQRRRLELKRERLRRLSQLSNDQTGRVNGGWGDDTNDIVGIQQSKLCRWE